MSTPDEVRREVFVSHSSEDAAVAQRICGLLEKGSIPCWIAPRDVRPGTGYGESIISAIQDASVFLLVMTKRANASRAVANEVERAFSNKKVIIPFRMENVPPSPALEFFIASSQWIEAWDGPLEKKVEQLADAVRASAGRTPAPDQVSSTSRPRTLRLWKPIAAAAACLCVLAVAALIHGRVKKEQRGSAVQAPVPAAAPITETGEKRIVPRYQALVIGINEYETHGGAGWSRLKTARSDAEAMANVLKSNYAFGVKALFDQEATRGAILDALDGLVDYGDNDACVIYFAGHGFYDEALGEGYWIPCDARKVKGARSAREDWLWNSMITKIISASTARHILVIADSCYGGSLFRGDQAADRRSDMNWYRRAIVKPSRYLIASGDLEPVLDDGATHSVFARQMLGFFDDPDRRIFSASDLGIALRERVSAVTGQMVQMGPLAVAGHAGGEFVFVRPDARERLAALQVRADPTGRTRDGAALPVRESRAASLAAVRRQLLRDTVTLVRNGATNAASRLLSTAVSGYGDDRLVQTVADYLGADRQAKARDQLDKLIAKLEERKSVAGADPEQKAVPRPRIMACIGPKVRTKAPDGESLALLYRISLRSEMAILGRLRLVEREALQAVLGEMDLGSSDVADPRARTAIGKLLPAGILLLGDVFTTENSDTVFMRLVDTETSQVFAEVPETRKAGEDVTDVCRRLATRIVRKAVEAKPLTVPAALGKNGTCEADIGSFHGVRKGTRFDLVKRLPGEARRLEPFKEKVVGQAEPVNVGEMRSEFRLTWEERPEGKPPRDLWLREVPEL